ncbi:toxic anion resistance protein [Clostridium mediterraneense]|uniref:toxic anion resistance protein n=1 Tax=Clostridium mediterraneense TaxID=1805472 RepID=UPI000A953C6D|nr:toxic anion resistance protein [Clostridium mediterraneense]
MNNDEFNKENIIDVDLDNQDMNSMGANHQEMNMGWNNQNNQQNQGMNMGWNNQNYQQNHDMNMGGYNQNHQQNQGMNMGGYNQNMNPNYNQGMNNGMNYGNPNMNMGYQNNMQANMHGMNNNMNAMNDPMQYGQVQQGVNNGYQQVQNNMGYQQNNMQYGYQNQGMGLNIGLNNQGGEMMPQTGDMSVEQINAQISEYKQRLRGMREVQALTSEVDIQNTNSIINFGQKASDNISKISDELLNSMRAVKSEEASEMLVSLTKIMDKFDVKEIKDAKPDSMISKIFKNVGTSVAKLFQKYDTMGYEVQKVYVLLKKYENDIRESNAHLKKLYDGNLEFYRLLEKYIVAGEMALEEIDGYLTQIPMDNSMNQEEKQMLIQKLEVSKEMLSQRVYDLQIAENVAIQAAPMIQTIQMSNFNLMRKINSSFIVTLPIFKQCLAQAVILKRQEIQAKSIKQLDDKTNELIMRNAQNTARQSVEIAKMASGSSVAIETLEKSFETIMKGIEDTKAIQEANRQQRRENSHKLETIKANMKRNIAES